MTRLPQLPHSIEAGSAGAQPTRATDERLAASFDHCRRVSRRRARNFYYGMKLTPEPKRSAMYAIYAFMRACDDLADDAALGNDAAARLQRIESFRAQMLDAMQGRLPDGPIWPAFRHVMARFPIDAAHLHAMLDGQACDLRKHRYADFAELRDYCFKVASVVGLVCVSVWSHDGHSDNLQMAEDRGVALQLTNILRDVVEDAQGDRVYLPADELARFGFDAESFKALVLSGRADERFDRLMAFQIDRARGFYESSALLDNRIDRTCRPTIWAVTHIYRRLLEKIAADPRRVLAGRVRLSSFTKGMIAARAVMRRGSRA